jgi:hypothetical protein
MKQYSTVEEEVEVPRDQEGMEQGVLASLWKAYVEVCLEPNGK